MSRSGFPTVPVGATLPQTNTVVDRHNRGKFNATMDFTLRTGSINTIINDDRLASTSAIIFDPLTANAASIKPYVLTANRANGKATITHPSSAFTDLTYRVLIIG